MPEEEELIIDVDKEWHLSATRITDWLTCPSMYHRKHILKQPSPRKSATQFGSALHAAIEKWHELGDKDLPIQEVWYGIYAEYFPTVWPQVRPMVIQSQLLDELEVQIMKRRPDLKGPRQTKEWLMSNEWRDFCEYKVILDDRIVEQEQDPKGLVFSKTEPPFKLWTLGLELAEKYVHVWEKQPDPIAIEISFEHPMVGNIWMRGRIDCIRPVVNVGTGECAMATIDWKSGVKPMTPQSAFVQGTIYAHATRSGVMPDEYFSDLVLFQSLREGTIQPFKYHDGCWPILQTIIGEVVHGLERKAYPRCFSMMGCGMCDYKDDCASELGVFPSGPVAAELLIGGEETTDAERGY